MKNLKAIRGRKYIHDLIQEGEHVHQDFKFSISDARKIARSISAFANNDGGHLLIGVKDNGVVAGIRNEEDVYMIETAAEVYCRPSVEVEMTAFKVDDGVVVLRASIPKTLRPPVVVLEKDGLEKAYYRVRDENFAAPDILLRAWDHSASAEGTLLRLDDRERLLVGMLEKEATVTVDRYIVASHSSRLQAVDLFGRMIASGVVELVHTGSEFAVALPR